MSRLLSLSILLSLSLCVTALADLHDPNNRADYLILTTSELIQDNPWITQLADWRNQHGRVSMVVPTEDVWAEFGDGSPLDTTLKDFLHYARRNWQAPQLRDVFIVGFHDVVPSHVEPDSYRVHYPDSTYYLHITYLTDLFYATDPESTNHIPVLAIGRLPWSPTQSPSLWDYFAKVVAYETADTAAWQTRVHLIADYDDAFFSFWEDFCEPLAQLVPEDWIIERDYPDFEEGHPWHGDREEILENLQSGSYLVAYMGHGTGNIWSHRLALEPPDFVSLTNGNRLPIITTTTIYDIYDSGVGGIPATLLANPNGGAIAYFGCSWNVWVSAGRSFRLILVEHATSDSVETLGELWRQTEEEFIQQYGISGESYRHTAFTCLLLGDPGLRLPERVSAVSSDIPTIPADMCLEGNYPNPFNSATTITFRLSHATKISLKIYDVLGREVATLYDGFHAAGSHTVSWDATGAPSGLYFCRMEAPGFAQTRKMLLIK
ncbi:MAG: C25 family cysteine peptidase [bacterium]